MLSTNAILPNLVIITEVHQNSKTSGLDHPDSCRSPRHFDTYPWPVSYCYNSRGFRDNEWPENFSGVIWCLGNSFTVGLGAPFEHIWPQRLGFVTGQRTINVSMNGASNCWMAEQAIQILDLELAETMIIQWTYTHRRQSDVQPFVEEQWQQFYHDIKDPSWPCCPTWHDRFELPKQIITEIEQDPGYQSVPVVCHEKRRIHHNRHAEDDVFADSEDLLEHMRQVELHKKSAVLVHTFIPDCSTDPQLYKTIQAWPSKLLYLPEIQRLDLARDGHHYDIVTADKLAKDLKQLLQN